MFCLHHISPTLQPRIIIYFGRYKIQLIFSLNFASLKLLKNYLGSFFAEKPQDYERGIMKLPKRLKSIVQNNGAYITE